ncbi:hypothetical protein [Mycoplasma procyoni]|uniref:hypothetical protein n=1 Tax=Mycoplasma procyoni TaxID=568784 RepID=UPI00197B3247|nr:hypothetical protein [Mycoplasma procyoni]MBN3534878.1 hypothetical protein [Mycoplasma procyoni]
MKIKKSKMKKMLFALTLSSVPFIAFSCGQPQSKAVQKEKESSIEFANLLELQQEEQEIVKQPFFILDNISHEKFNNDNSDFIIETEEDFKNDFLFKFINEEQKNDNFVNEAKKEFQKSFLKNKNLSEVLASNKIAIFVNYDEKDYEAQGFIVKNLNKSTDEKLVYNFVLPTIFSEFPVRNKLIETETATLTVIVIPKEKHFDVKATSVQDSKILYKDLKTKFKDLKPLDLFLNKSVNLLDKLQKQDGIIHDSAKFLISNSKNTTETNNLFLKDNFVIIKTKEDFENQILKRYEEVTTGKQEEKLSREDIINEFETKFLSNKKLEDELREHDLVLFQSSFNKFYDNDNYKERLVVNKKENDKIVFSYLKPSQIDLKFSYSNQQNFVFSSDVLQVAKITKNLRTEFKKELSKKEIFSLLEPFQNK